VPVGVLLLLLLELRDDILLFLTVQYLRGGQSLRYSTWEEGRLKEWWWSLIVLPKCRNGMNEASLLWYGAKLRVLRRAGRHT